MQTKQLYLDTGHINRPGTKMTVTGVVVHWTANEGKGSNAVANRNYFNRKWRMLTNPKTGKLEEYELKDEDGKPVLYRYASAHLNVDDTELIECLPWKKGQAEKGYHVGSSSGYNSDSLKKLNTTSPNNCTIGLEICVNSDGDFAKAYANGVKVIAMMLKEHGLGIDKLFRHYDITGKLCPGFHTQDVYAQKYLKTTAAKAWSDFKTAVSKELTGTSSSTATPPKPTITKERVYATGGVLKSVDLNGASPYSTKATDVRFLKLPKGTFEMKLVWTKGKTVTQLVKEHKADFAFNFPFFWDGNPVADTKIDSKVLFNATSGKTTAWSGFAFKNGAPIIGDLNIKDNYDNGFLVKASPLLVSNGAPCWSWSINRDQTAPDIANGRSQRTFIGIDAQGNFMLAVGDGRTTYDQGLTIEEASLFMKGKGAVMALNGDGGGSSVIADSTGSLGQNKGSSERAVNHAILIYLKTPTTTQPATPPVVVPAPTPTPAPEAPKPVYRVMLEGKQQGAYSVLANGQKVVQDMYRANQSPNLFLANPDGSATYTPSKHPEDFPDLVVDKLNADTQKSILEYLKKKFQ